MLRIICTTGLLLVVVRIVVRMLDSVSDAFFGSTGDAFFDFD